MKNLFATVLAYIHSILLVGIVAAYAVNSNWQSGMVFGIAGIAGLLGEIPIIRSIFLLILLIYVFGALWGIILFPFTAIIFGTIAKAANIKLRQMENKILAPDNKRLYY